MSADEIVIEPVTEKDKKCLVEFLKKNFYVDEPITDYLKIAEDPEAASALGKFSTKNLNQNLSFVARDNAGNLAGVCINSIKSKDDPEDEVESPLFNKITTMLGLVYENAKVFEKFPDVDKVLYIDILSVNKKYGGKGIGTIFVNKTRDLARKNGIKLMRVDCTSHFSARASARLGMECIYELKYSDYIVDGVQVFKPDPPHNEVKVYVQRLNE